MGAMKVADPVLGDRRITWDKGKPKEVEDAEASFEHMTKDLGYAAFAVKRGGKKGEQVRTFDPNLEEMLLMPALAGG